MKHYRIVLLGLFTISLSLLLGSCEKDEEIIERTEWVLSWSDEFDTPTEDGKPDPSKWVHETGATGNGNQELQNYTDRERFLCNLQQPGMPEDNRIGGQL